MRFVVRNAGPDGSVADGGVTSKGPTWCTKNKPAGGECWDFDAVNAVAEKWTANETGADGNTLDEPEPE